MRRTPAQPTMSFFMPEHLPLSQHVGQLLVLGQYPNQKKIEIVFVNKKTHEIRYKILPKN